MEQPRPSRWSREEPAYPSAPFICVHLRHLRFSGTDCGTGALNAAFPALKPA
jgi:hypothetical protein